jgi:hypothetical protein
MHNANKKEMLRMAKKSGTTKEYKVIETNEQGEQVEVTYLFQHPGVRAGVQIRGRSKDATGHLDEEKYYTELMKHVIVQPKTDWDYWEEHEGFMEVIKEASSFLID